MFYKTSVVYRGKVIPLSNLKPSSDKKVQIVCPECNVEFTRFFKVLTKTCSFVCQKCKLATNKKTLIAGSQYSMLTVIEESRGAGYSFALCSCGKRIEVSNYNLTSGKTQSCGCIISIKLKAYHLLHPGIVAKEKSPHWKGGLSSNRGCHMSIAVYKNWRTAVFTRDGFRCLACNTNSNTLEAHHVQAYSTNLELQTEVGNGATMCKACHKKFHALYGYRHIGITELDAFIQIQN